MVEVSVVPTDDSGPSAANSDVSNSSYILKDRYGFYVSDQFHQQLQITPDVVKFRRNKETERTKKWLDMIQHWSKFYKHDKKSKLNRRVRKGIPDAVRGLVWQRLINIDAVKEKIPNPYEIDTGSLCKNVIDEIDRDVDRTFPRHVQFIENEGDGQQSLRRLLQWYAVLDPAVGYCQGMGFIAALFLTYMQEEDAFYCFYATLNRETAPLRLLYLPKLVDVQKMLFVFEELGRQHLGKLWMHLEAEGMHPTMYFTEWIMCIFCRSFSFDLVTRVWDIFLSEGTVKIVYRVALAIIKTFEHELLNMKFDEIMSMFRNLPQRIDSEAVMTLCWTIPLKTSEITTLEEQYKHDNPERFKSI